MPLKLDHPQNSLLLILMLGFAPECLASMMCFDSSRNDLKFIYFGEQCTVALHECETVQHFLYICVCSSLVKAGRLRIFIHTEDADSFHFRS